LQILNNKTVADAEINAIIARGGNILTFLDGSDSNILVYNDNQWVSYMDPSNKTTRTIVYQSLNMGGVTDWAVDLDASLEPSAKVCIAGTGPGNLATVCSFTCALGFCPPPCTCTAEGEQSQLPPATGQSGFPISGGSDGSTSLCEFACALGTCPPDACSTTPTSGDGGNIIFLPPSIWSGKPSFGCNQDCTFVLPPSPLPEPETITWPALTTTLLSSSGGSIFTVTTVIDVPPFTITAISYWAITVQSNDPIIATFTAEQSIMPPAFVIV